MAQNGDPERVRAKLVEVLSFLQPAKRLLNECIAEAKQLDPAVENTVRNLLWCLEDAVNDLRQLEETIEDPEPTGRALGVIRQSCLSAGVIIGRLCKAFS
jgi:hypothetical protein